MIAEALRSQLVTDTAVAALVGTRVFPLTRPQGMGVPAITYAIDSDELSPLLDGNSSSLREALFSIDSWAMGSSECHGLAYAVEDALLHITNGQLGALSPAQYVDLIRLSRGSIDLFETDTKLYRVSQQFSVAYYP